MSANRLPVQAVIEWASASKALGESGDSRSGDALTVVPFENGVLVAGIDGLGHGSEAARAAGKAVEILESHVGEAIEVLFQKCHEGLSKTRGVVMSLASFRTTDSSMTWAAVGNVDGLLLRSDPFAEPRWETILARGGVIGYQMPKPRVTTLPVSRGDTLILTTDGIKSDFATGLVLREHPQRTADFILDHYCRGSDDALVVVAKYLGP